MLDVRAMIRNSPETREAKPLLDEVLATSYRMICEDFRFHFWLTDSGVITREIKPDLMRLEFAIKDKKAYQHRLAMFCERNYHRWGWTVHHTLWTPAGVTLTFRNDTP
jgi:hypothetical protein